MTLVEVMTLMEVMTLLIMMMTTTMMILTFPCQFQLYLSQTMKIKTRKSKKIMLVMTLEEMTLVKMMEDLMIMLLMMTWRMLKVMM